MMRAKDEKNDGLIPLSEQLVDDLQLLVTQADVILPIQDRRFSLSDFEACVVLSARRSRVLSATTGRIVRFHSWAQSLALFLCISDGARHFESVNEVAFSRDFQ